MSSAEIADNKWEVESTKPPVVTAAGIAQILLMGMFGLFFLYILIMSVVGIVSPKQEGSLEQKYKEKLEHGGAATAPAEEAPAE